MRIDPDALRSRRVRLRTGPTLRCGERAGGGETVLLLHGYSDSGHAFAPLVPWLPAGWRLLAPDQRGHGESDRPSDGYAISALAADAAALLDAVDAERATVVGHSMGSLVALQLALDHPERVARLVLVGATARIEALDDLAREVRALPDPVPGDFVRDFQLSTLKQPVPGPFLEQVIAESRRLPARVWRAVFDGFERFDVSERLDCIGCPTLVVWGAHDTIFGRVAQEALVAGIPGAVLRVYADAGHAPHWEEPERFACDLAAFVGGGGPLAAPVAGIRGDAAPRQLVGHEELLRELRACRAAPRRRARARRGSPA